MAYKSMDTMTLRESMAAFPWQDSDYMSFRPNGVIHKRGQGKRSVCGLEAPAFGHNWYETFDESHRAFCKRCAR